MLNIIGEYYLINRNTTLPHRILRQMLIDMHQSQRRITDQSARRVSEIMCSSTESARKYVVYQVRARVRDETHKLLAQIRALHQYGLRQKIESCARWTFIHSTARPVHVYGQSPSQHDAVQR